MSDEKTVEPTSATTDAAPAQEETCERKLFGVPVSVFVRGGTTTAAHDAEQAQLTADAEARRAQADEDRRVASIPVNDGGGVMYGGRLQPGAGDPLYVELHYVNERGEPILEFTEPMRCLADIVLVAEGELAFIMVCPRCKERGVPLDRCQMQIRQSNRKWDFSQKRAGEPIPWIEGVNKRGEKQVKFYRSAGTIVETEMFRCFQCNWAARVVDNKVRPA